MSFSVQGSSNTFVGDSQQVRLIRAQIDQLRQSRAPVMLFGESGTGKEVIAKALHDSTARGSFVPIDCASMVGTLMESELFGHARGAFTGASHAKKGLLDVANGGTAFFDEVGELPLELQVKLLRVLQEREFRPVGSLQVQQVDIRVISATHRDLPRGVDEATFRRDLFYRLNVITIRVPPLRERKGDIPLLIRHFLAGRCETRTVTDEAMELLIRYAWPGNIRELHNALERLVALSAGACLPAENLPSSVLNASFSQSLRAMSAIVSEAPQGRVKPLDQQVLPLHEVEKRAIAEALEKTKGDRSLAATLLRIGRTTLYRKMRGYERRTKFNPEAECRRQDELICSS